MDYVGANCFEDFSDPPVAFSLLFSTFLFSHQFKHFDLQFRIELKKFIYVPS